MSGVGILDGDLLAVHRTAEARSGQIVVARLEDEMTVKRLQRRGGRVELIAENPDYAPIVVNGPCRGSMARVNGPLTNRRSRGWVDSGWPATVKTPPWIAPRRRSEKSALAGRHRVVASCRHRIRHLQGTQGREVNLRQTFFS